MCCASAPGCSPAIVATTWRGRSVVSSAHSTTAPRARSHPSRAARRTTSRGSSSSARARSSSRKEPRRFCSTSSLASSTATSVREATAARWRNSSASGGGGPAPSSRTPPITSSPELIGTSAAMPGGTCTGRRGEAGDEPDAGSSGRNALPPGEAEARSATYRRSSARSIAGPGDVTAAPRRGMTIATAPPAASAASSATRPRPSPPSTASTISRWTARSRSISDGRPAGSAGWAAATILLARSVDRLGCRVGVRLQRLFARLPRADPVRLLHRQHEHLAVSDGAGARVPEDGVDDRLHVTRGDHALDLHLRPQVVRELRAAVALRDALLAAGPLDLHDGERGEAQVQELHPDRLEGLVPDERLDFLHDAGTSCAEGAGRRRSREPPRALA